MKTGKSKKLSLAQARVEIAQDVVRALKAKHLVAKKGVYCQVNKPDLFLYAEPGDQYGDILKQMRCEVCGIGAIFVAAVERFDEYTIQDHVGVLADNEKPHLFDRLPSCDLMRKYLLRYFTASQLDCIELIFEKWGNTDSREFKFSIKYNEAKDRMVAIMENIIKNKGALKI